MRYQIWQLNGDIDISQSQVLAEKDQQRTCDAKEHHPRHHPLCHK